MAGILALVLTGFFTDPAGTVGFGVKIYTPYTYALTQTEVILHYLKLSFLPVGLTLDYLDWPPCTSLLHCWKSVAAVAVITIITAIGVLMRTAWSFPAAWFLVCIAPTSSIVPVQDAAFEHRMYLPLAGVVALVVCGVAALALRWSANARVLGLIAGAAILTLGLLTASRNEDYSNTTRLIRDNAEKRPANGRVRMNLAVQLFGTGDVAGAEEQLNEAMRLPLKLPSLRAEYVKVMRESGLTAEAIRVAEEVHRETPDSIMTGYELGLSLLTDGRAAEALPYLERAATEKSDNQFIMVHYAVSLRRPDRPRRPRPPSARRTNSMRVTPSG